MNQTTRRKNTLQEDIVEYCERTWSTQVKWFHADTTLGMHYGYYEKGIRTFAEAVVNMHDLVGRLLDLDAVTSNSPIFLDAGCGVGGTSIHLAKKYPHIYFIGISIVPGQIFLAKKFAQEHHVSKNTEFILGDFLETSMPDTAFDGVFALESVNYAEDKKRFVMEAHRILKPGNKLVVIDGFLTKKPSNYFMRVAYEYYRKIWVVPHMTDFQAFIIHLKTAGFEDIAVRDISKQIRLSFIIGFLKNLSYFLSMGIKKSSKSKHTRLTRNPFINCILSIFSPLLVNSSRMVRYLTITACKKSKQ
jgi:ubiquinone/menaquinone biosynthesis C-methylase UbiE